MNDIEIWELRIKANAAINHLFSDEEKIAIQEAVVKAINENSNHRLLLGEVTLEVTPRF